MTAWPAWFVRNNGESCSCGQGLSAVAGVHRRGVDDQRQDYQRQFVPVHDESVLHIQLPAVNRVWASGAATADNADHDAIDDHQLGFKGADFPEQCKIVHVEIIFHPDFVPSSKSAVSVAARTHELGRDFSQRQPVTSTYHGDFDHPAVRHARPAAFWPYGLPQAAGGSYLH